MTQESILTPPQRKISTSQGAIQVRKVSAIAMLSLVRQVAGKVKDFTDDAGNFRLSPDRFAEVVMHTEALAIQLVQSATGQEHLEEALNAEEFLEVLEAALDINFTEDFFVRAASLGRTLQGRFGKWNGSSPQASVGSSDSAT